MISHLVLMKVNDASDAAFVADEVLGMRGKIPGLVSVVGGVSVISTATTWDLGFTMMFEDKETVATYQSHPAHVKVGSKISGMIRELATSDLEI